MKFQQDNGKSVRLSLTENCNYRCFFCHEEGVSMKDCRKDVQTLDDMYQLIMDLIHRGYHDITLTGGEPLIKKAWCMEIINRLSKIQNPPDLTIVTNGVIMDDEVIQTAKNYSGDFKFNISMHHTDKDKYLAIVNPKSKNRNFHEVVLKNIANATKNGIVTKMNFVILKGINNSYDDLIEILELGKKLKVISIKFLEFLVTDKLIDKYNYYFELEAVKQRLSDDLSHMHTSLRTDYYSYKDSDLVIELSQCPCSIGCKNCHLVNGLTITSELKYFPCFFRSQQEFYLPGQIDTGLQAGAKIIQDFANKYETSTPFKIHQPKAQYQEQGYVYTSLLSLSELESMMKTIQARLVAKREFTEYLYTIKSKNNIIKTYKNSSNDNIFVVNKDIFMSGRDNNYLIESFNSRFQQEIAHKEEFQEEYGKPIDDSFWSICFYEVENLHISLGIVNKNSTIYIKSNQELDKDSFKMFIPLTTSIEQDVYQLADE